MRSDFHSKWLFTLAAEEGEKCSPENHIMSVNGYRKNVYQLQEEEENVHNVLIITAVLFLATFAMLHRCD